MTPNEGFAPGDLIRRLRDAAAGKRERLLLDYVEHQIRAIAPQIAGSALRLRPEDRIFELGLGSLLVVELKARLEQEFGTDLPVALFFAHASVGDLAHELTELAFRDEAGVGPLPGEGAAQTIVKLDRRLEHAQSARRVPIAIVGMACRFPGGADTPEAFWRTLRDGRSTVREIPADRLDLSALYDPDPDRPGKMYMRHGCFLDQVDGFDASFFRISPREAAQMDPQQRLVLEVAWEALENAGIPPIGLTGSQTGVFAGVLTNDYAHLPGTLAERIDAYYYPGTNSSFIAGRLSYFLGLHGPSVTLDTACSSSLVAVHLACQSLLAGESNLALAGGVNLILSPETSMFLCKARAVSPSGQCRAFDDGADGMLRGEGCAMVVLKRLEDAVDDGDEILAVLRGSAVNHDGASGGLTVPNPIAQERLYRAALAAAALTPAEIDYVEAHGTGTPLGDPVELQGLAATFGEGRDPAHPLIVGSVKTNIGHTDSAAGVANLVKAVLMLRHEQVPPSLNFARPTAQFDWNAHPIAVADRLHPLRHGPGPARIGVSSFGLSGVNAHAVLESYEPPERVPQSGRPASSGPDLLALSAANEPALRQLAATYRDRLAARTDVSTGDLCAAAAIRRSHLSCRRAFVGESAAALAGRIEEWLSGTDEAAVRTPDGTDTPRRIAFVFSGQGPQSWDMGRELMDGDPEVRLKLEEIDASFSAVAGWSLLGAMTAGESVSRIHETEVAQPAMFAMQVALAHRWKCWGVAPDAVLGHSMGEVAAAHVAGVLDLDAAVKVIHDRGRLLGGATGGGAMLAVGMPLDACERLVAEPGNADRVSIAAYNSPAACVLSGDTDAVEAIRDRLEAQGVFCRTLKVKFASHCYQMEAFQPQLAAALEGLSPAPARISMVSSVSGGLASPGDYDAAYWARNIRAPVLFATGVDTLIELGIDTFLEVGPHPVLASSIEECLESRDRSGLLLHSLRHDEGERQALLESLGALYTHGWPVHFPALYQRPAHAVRLPNYPWQRRRYWLAPAGPDAGSIAELEGATERLLGERVDSPLPETQYRTWLSRERPAYLDGHRVGGSVVAPAALLLALASAGANDATRTRKVLADVVFSRPLVLGDEPAAVQVVVGPRDAADTCEVSVHGRGQGAAGWTLHTTGVALSLSDEDTGPALESLGAIRERCASRSVKDFYAAMNATGVAYHDRFRAVRELRVGAHEVIARVAVEAASAETEAAGGLHPAILDGCLHAMMAGFDFEDAASPFVPAGVERFSIVGSPADEAWCHCRLHERDGSTLRADIDLRDAQGALFGRVEGLVLRQLPERSAENALREDAYELRWQHQAIESYGPDQPASRQWVLFIDERGLGVELAGRLETSGAPVVTVRAGAEYRAPGSGAFVLDPTDPDHFCRLATDLPVDRLAGAGIVYLWGLDAAVPDDPADACIARDQERLCGGLLHLTQMLASANLHHPPRLQLVTAGAVSVAPGETGLCPSQASLWGFMRVAAIEHPEIDCACLDIEPAGHGDQAGLIVKEALFGANEPQVAIRQGARHVARLARSVARAGTPRATHELRTLSLESFGILDDLRLRPMTRRAPGPGEVEIAVRAAGLNFRDVLSALGMLGDLLHAAGIDSADRLPFGFECSGTVSALGPGVDRYRVGDEVVAGLVPGCMSSAVIAPVTHVMAKPDALTHAEAATLPIAFFTAFHALHDLAGMQPGDRVLIHSAAGGVGQVAVQLAQQAGAEVFATASRGKWEMLHEQGVEHVMDSRSLDFAEQVLAATGGRGVDIVLNCLAGEYIDRSLEVCAEGGRFVELGAIDVLGPADVSDRRPDLSYSTFHLQLGAAERPDLVAHLFEELARALESGAIRPLPCEPFPIERAAEAFRHMAQARHRGKVVLTNPAQPAPEPFHCRPGASYLITGGLGGLGLRVAGWLAEQGARHLLLAGRSAPDDAIEEMLAGLREDGVRVRTVQADVSEFEEVRRLVDQADEPGRPLAGVVHAAAVLDDGVLARQTPERFSRVLAPKAVGAWHLHLATANRRLDFFACFSSAVALLGAPGQASYAAANAFLDTLAHYRRSLGLTGLSVNWGPWAGTGLAARLSERDEARWAARGLSPFAPERGLAALGLALDDEATQLLFAPTDWTRYLDRTENAGQRALVANLSGAAQPAIERPVGMLASLESAAPDARPGLVAACVREDVARVLGLAGGDEIGPRQRLLDLGLDSLMALELRRRLEVTLGRRLRPTVIFDYPTIEALVGHLIDDVLDLAPSAAPTDTGAGAPAAGSETAGLDELGRDELAGLLESELGEIPRNGTP